MSIRGYFERRTKAKAQKALAQNLRTLKSFLVAPQAAEILAGKGLKLDFSALQTAIGGVSGWKFSQPLFAPDTFNPYAAQAATISHLKFLLASAPMIEVPTTPMEAGAWVRNSRAPFAYIHPKTLAKITFNPIKGHFMVFNGSPTKWVLTSLMPERRVIFSPLAIPGLEKILAA